MAKPDYVREMMETMSMLGRNCRFSVRSEARALGIRKLAAMPLAHRSLFLGIGFEEDVWELEPGELEYLSNKR